ncbi:MAG: glycosyltransferase family 2 protein [Lewinellaceae bacterium]|nr:glycosyltransferase family 2 protein [Lewinellaceae bacterium]
MTILPITVIVLTWNEERNIADCLRSVQDFAGEILVVDSGSTDRTVEIARGFGAVVVEHPFENYSRQRNWALQNLPLHHDWVLHLDADHRVTDKLKNTLQGIFSTALPDDLNGFMVSRRTIFMGKWIRFGGHYPVYHAVLFRKNKGYCEEKRYDQHFKVEGKIQKLHGDIVDIITDSLGRFTERHNRWSTLEAEEIAQGGVPDSDKLVQANAFGNPMQQRRFLKVLYEHMPLFVRPMFYFFIRYFLRLGFLDGRRGLIFHFLQGFWFRFLVDAKVFERKHRAPF